MQLDRYQRQISKSVVVRDVFWRAIAQVGKPLLIVCDQVADAQQLAELLPSNPEHMGRCRVLALSMRRLTVPGLEDVLANIELGGLSPVEAQELFVRHSSSVWAAQHRSALKEISRHLEHVPQLLALAARDMLNGSLSPASFLQHLAEGRREHRLLNASVTAALDLAIRDLTAAQIALLEFTGVLGEGDWNYRMLAAVARRGPEAMKPDLARLVDRDLVRQVRAHRYRANTLVREFALHRLSRQPAYIRVAAASLLARHCLDLAQDAYVLATRSLGVGAAAPGAAWLTEETVNAFRDTLRPELSHLRRALNWAVEQEDWDLLLRFAYVPALELFTHLVANRVEVRIALTMPTLIEPVTRSTEQPPSSDYAALITSADWSLTKPTAPGNAGSSSTTNTVRRQRAALRERQRCELIWNITAGHIVDGVFTDTSLVDSSWKGVRAPGLVCRDVDIVGSQLLACDLSQSVLFDCDARQAQLSGTVLQDALLVDVRLHNANLRGINANGAILEGVDMRGVDLRDATLIGATLEDVDLRGADLRAANLSGATLIHVNLSGCQLQSVSWAGATLDDASRASIEDVAHWRVIEVALAELPDTQPRSPMTRRRPKEFEPGPSGEPLILTDQDARARRLGKQHFPNAILSQADLRATDFGLARLEGVVADRVNGRGVSFRGGRLQRAQLTSADLRAADLSEANLTRATLAKAILRSASASDAILVGANVREADLRYADLSQADLREADLTGADLRGANLRGARLEDALLSGANLVGTNLSEARLHGADLRGACGSYANLRDAAIDELQLTSIGALGGAVLPTGNVVPLFDDRFEATLPEAPERRFAQWSGEFVACELSGLNMFGAYLNGRFVYCRLDGVVLERAHMVGIFVGCVLTGAQLVGARLSGLFYEVDFTGANLAEASLAGASFVNCKLGGAKVTDAQLREATRLRGSQLSLGRYDGRFELQGDLEDARMAGLDHTDPEALRSQFYDLDSVPFRQF